MIGIHQLILRSARPALLLFLGLLAAALLLAHSAVAGGHHQDEAEHSSGNALVACLAVLDLAGAVTLLRGLRRPILSFERFRRPPGMAWPSSNLVPVAAFPAPARAGPATLQVFRL